MVPAYGACKVFISSTTNDLLDIRRKIADIITESENVPIMAENMISVNNSPKEAIEKKLDECDCYIGVFHKKWGYVPPENNPEKLSVTAIEYRRAKKNSIPRLILISKEQKDKELEDFIENLSDYEVGDWKKEYRNFQELLKLVTQGINKLVEAAAKTPVGGDKNTHVDSKRAYREKIEDVPVEEVEFLAEKIASSTNPDVQASAWADMELLARGKRLWKHNIVWDILRKQLLDDPPVGYVNEALFVLKGIVFTSINEHDEEAITRVKQTFQSRLVETLTSDVPEWSRSRSDIKQIIDCIYGKEERFHIFWNAWKRAAENFESDDEYQNCIAYFINDLGVANMQLKNLIKRDLYDLIDSANERMSRRAKSLRQFLFG